MLSCSVIEPESACAALGTSSSANTLRHVLILSHRANFWYLPPVHLFKHHTETRLSVGHTAIRDDGTVQGFKATIEHLTPIPSLENASSLYPAPKYVTSNRKRQQTCRTYFFTGMYRP